MKKKVLINVTFKDRYTGKLRVAGKTATMTEERIKEINDVNPNFVSVIGNVENANNDDGNNDVANANSDGGNDGNSTEN